MASSQSHNYHLHFLLVPFLGFGHVIPMINMAKLLAQQQNVTVTFLTTPLNAIRYRSRQETLINSGLPVRFLELPFPGTENGLPEGCESVETLPGMHLFPKFSAAMNMLQERLEQRFESLNPRPHCIISDKFVSRSEDTALMFNIPWIIFDANGCFTQLSAHYLSAHNDIPESETFVLSGLPHRIEMTRAQLPHEFSDSDLVIMEHFKRLRESESRSYGKVVNSFEELEGEYVKEFKKLKRGKVWCLGPLSLYNDNDLGCGSDEDQHYLKWLNSKEHGSVVYACFSGSQMIPAQIIELGLALEASGSPFIWVIRAGKRSKEVEKWLAESGFENRIKDRGLLIRDWAPQVLILSHPSVGGFLTNCGWNSTLEGVCAGVPMITWPQISKQFLNEKLIVQVLGIGVSVGASVMVHRGQEEKYGVTVKSEQVKTAIEQVMRVGSEGDEIKKKAKPLRVAAKKAIEEGGSSHNNVTLLIHDIWELTNVKSQKSLT